MQLTMANNLLKQYFQIENTISNMSAVSLQLRLPRSSRPDAASQTRQIFAMSGQTRQQIAKLGQLNLNNTLTGLGASSKNIQYKLRTVNDLHIQCFFEITYLCTRKLLIKNGGSCSKLIGHCF
ncbi:hypothetical protein D3C78_1210290 [compost metagenome]